MFILSCYTKRVMHALEQINLIESDQIRAEQINQVPLMFTHVASNQLDIISLKCK